jgi:hypothetical protein
VRDRSPAERAAIPGIDPDSEPGERRKSRAARGTRDSDSGNRRSDVLHDPDRGVFALCSGLHKQAHSWNDERFCWRGNKGGRGVARLWHIGCSRCEYGTTVRAGRAHELTRCDECLDAPRRGRPVPAPVASGAAAIEGLYRIAPGSPVCTENLSSGVVVVKSAKDGV